MFENVMFWCEFPDRINWEELNYFFLKNNFTAVIGIACTSRADFEEKKARIGKLSNIKVKLAWPTLPKEKGYWFSSHTSREDIESLSQYKGVKIKLDIEPPIPKGNYKKSMAFWLLKSILKKGRNKLIIPEGAMLSTFPFPKFILKNLGMVFDNKLEYNYIFYSTFIPKLFKSIYRSYMKYFISKRLEENENTFFAAGLLTEGIFGNEPIYQNVKEFDSDLAFLEENNVKNIVIFHLGSFQELKNPEKWLNVIKTYLI